MAPKKSHSTPSKHASSPSTTSNTSNTSTTFSTSPSSILSIAPTSSSSSSLPSLSPKSSPWQIAQHISTRYLHTTPPRTKLLDAFLAYLVLVGGVQFVYCVVAGNYPFNAFLSGFCAAVGQFVLTASLRMQTVEKAPNQLSSSTSSSSTATGAKKSTATAAAEKQAQAQGKGAAGEKGGISSERAFADYVFGSLILHAFCVNFIN
ncbi:MAG: hypothetical protein Q9160_006526 [Pyrenula sp. 1 TL-2023]